MPSSESLESVDPRVDETCAAKIPLPEKLAPHPGPQQKFLDSTADIAIYGGQAGGGKTWALLAEAVRNTRISRFGAVIFRRTSPQITNEGGLWDESMELYPKLDGKSKHTLDWYFKKKDETKKKEEAEVTGANIGFRHLQYETDKLAWQGSQIAMLGFDELTHFTETQFFYLLSRNRSVCGIKPYVRATTNPTPADDPVGGWVTRLVSWWIDQKTGFAIADRSGQLRWFIRRQGELKSATARLNALIGRPSLGPLASPTGFRVSRVISLAQVQALARSANPMLALAGAQSNSAAQTKSLTDLNYYPDVTLGAKYVQRPGTEDTGEFMLGVKLPLHYEVKDAEQRSAGARLGAAQARGEALRLRIDGQIADAWFSVDALRKVIQIYAARQLPPSRSSVENARNGFQAGSADLSTVFESERRLRTIQLDLLKLKVELQSKYAEMERLAGGSL